MAKPTYVETGLTPFSIPACKTCLCRYTCPLAFFTEEYFNHTIGKENSKKLYLEDLKIVLAVFSVTPEGNMLVNTIKNHLDCLDKDKGSERTFWISIEFMKLEFINGRLWTNQKGKYGGKRCGSN